MQILTLEMSIFGRARIVDIREHVRDDKPTGKIYVTLRYEGGELNLPVEPRSIEGFGIGDVVEVWLTSSPKDYQYTFQGRIISNPGFRVLGIAQMQKVDLTV